MISLNIEKNYGKNRFDETTHSMTDFEESFITYFLTSNDPLGFLSKFGNLEFAEINNPLINDYKKSFTQYFY